MPGLEVDLGTDFEGCREQSNHKVKFCYLGALKCKGPEEFHLKGKSKELDALVTQTSAGRVPVL